MTIMTRRQLYDLIWSKPMRDAAAEIAISDVGLKKVCVRHRVPVPPQGYWNKVHAGQTPAKAIFRDVTDSRSMTAGGVWAGATRPFQPTTSKPGRTFSHCRHVRHHRRARARGHSESVVLPLLMNGNAVIGLSK